MAHIVISIFVYSMLSYSHGYPHGAPCSSVETMRPKHSTGKPQVIVNKRVEITVNDGLNCFSNRHKNSARFSLVEEMRAGEFIIEDNVKDKVKYQCDEIAAVTHKTDESKQKVNVTWKPSWTNGDASATFIATVIINSEKDWYRVKSQEIKPCSSDHISYKTMSIHHARSSTQNPISHETACPTSEECKCLNKNPTNPSIHEITCPVCTKWPELQTEDITSIPLTTSPLSSSAALSTTAISHITTMLGHCSNNNDCFNGGACDNTTRECKCLRDYTGPQCEKSLHEQFRLRHAILPPNVYRTSGNSSGAPNYTFVYSDGPIEYGDCGFSCAFCFSMTKSAKLTVTNDSFVKFHQGGTFKITGADMKNAGEPKENHCLIQNYSHLEIYPIAVFEIYDYRTNGVYLPVNTMNIQNSSIKLHDHAVFKVTTDYEGSRIDIQDSVVEIYNAEFRINQKLKDVTLIKHATVLIRANSTLLIEEAAPFILNRSTLVIEKNAWFRVLVKDETYTLQRPYWSYARFFFSLDIQDSILKIYDAEFFAKVSNILIKHSTVLIKAKSLLQLKGKELLLLDRSSMITENGARVMDWNSEAGLYSNVTNCSVHLNGRTSNDFLSDNYGVLTKYDLWLHDYNWVDSNISFLSSTLLVHVSTSHFTGSSLIFKTSLMLIHPENRVQPTQTYGIQLSNATLRLSDSLFNNLYDDRIIVPRNWFALKMVGGALNLCNIHFELKKHASLELDLEENSYVINSGTCNQTCVTNIKESSQIEDNRVNPLLCYHYGIKYQKLCKCNYSISMDDFAAEAVIHKNVKFPLNYSDTPSFWKNSCSCN